MKCVIGQCRESFTLNSRLVLHVQEKHNRFLCIDDACAKHYSTEKARKLHFSEKHAADRKVFRCVGCGKLFKQKGTHKYHIRHTPKCEGKDCVAIAATEIGIFLFFVFFFIFYNVFVCLIDFISIPMIFCFDFS